MQFDLFLLNARDTLPPRRPGYPRYSRKPSCHKNLFFKKLRNKFQVTLVGCFPPRAPVSQRMQQRLCATTSGIICAKTCFHCAKKAQPRQRSLCSLDFTSDLPTPHLFTGGGGSSIRRKKGSQVMEVKWYGSYSPHPYNAEMCGTCSGEGNGTECRKRTSPPPH